MVVLRRTYGRPRKFTRAIVNAMHTECSIDYGLALRVPISFLVVPQSSSDDSGKVPYLKITDFLKHLLNKFEEVLFAGLKADSDAARDLCSTFWSRYQSYHGDHVIYSEVPAKDRSFCVPILVHGDKGRTLQKKAPSSC